MLSDEAVEAAAKIVYRTSGRKRVMSYEQARPACMDEARGILEAAAPHMLAEAWEAGAAEAWSRSTPEVNGAAYKWRHEGEPANPHRSQA